MSEEHLYADQSHAQSRPDGGEEDKLVSARIERAQVVARQGRSRLGHIDRLVGQCDLDDIKNKGGQ